jgi:hypothetical protein
MNALKDEMDIAFSIQTMQTKIGNGLKSITPDEQGVYNGVPLAVIGKPSRNNILYDPNSFVNAIVNPDTKFYKSLISGALEGEWGHPLTVGLSKQDTIMRNLQIDNTKVSHYFTKIYTKKSKDGQYNVVYGNVVPFGPNGKYLKESFEDPKRNASFSLRSLTTEPVAIGKGIFSKKIYALITFDSVSIPGYEEACKCFMDISSESFKYDLLSEDICKTNINDIISSPCINEVVGQEHITQQSLLDLVKADKVTLELNKSIIVGKFNRQTGSVSFNRDGTIVNASAFHSLF